MPQDETEANGMKYKVILRGTAKRHGEETGALKEQIAQLEAELAAEREQRTTSESDLGAARDEAKQQQEDLEGQIGTLQDNLTESDTQIGQLNDHFSTVCEILRIVLEKEGIELEQTPYSPQVAETWARKVAGAYETRAANEKAREEDLTKLGLELARIYNKHTGEDPVSPATTFQDIMRHVKVYDDAISQYLEKKASLEKAEQSLEAEKNRTEELAAQIKELEEQLAGVEDDSLAVSRRAEETLEQTSERVQELSDKLKAREETIAGYHSRLGKLYVAITGKEIGEGGVGVNTIFNAIHAYHTEMFQIQEAYKQVTQKIQHAYDAAGLTAPEEATPDMLVAELIHNLKVEYTRAVINLSQIYEAATGKKPEEVILPSQATQAVLDLQKRYKALEERQKLLADEREIVGGGFGSLYKLVTGNDWRAESTKKRTSDAQREFLEEARDEVIQGVKSTYTQIRSYEQEAARLKTEIGELEKEADENLEHIERMSKEIVALRAETVPEE